MTFKGLTISGGSFKGISALGALHFLYEQNLLSDIKYYSGTSVGGLIIILLAFDITPFEIFSFIYSETKILDILFTKDTFFEYVTKRIDDLSQSMGLLRIYETLTYKIEEFLLKKINKKKVPTFLELYEESGKEIYLVTTKETSTGNFEKVVLSHKTTPNLSLLRGGEMSANLPWMFCKLKEDGEDYIDGGFSDDFPFELLKENMQQNDKIFSIFIEEAASKQKGNPISYMYRLVTYPIRQNSQYKIDRMSEEDKKNLLMLQVPVDDPSNFNLTRGTRMDYFMGGYKQAEEFLTRN